MAIKKIKNTRHQKFASVFSIMTVIFLIAAFMVGSLQSNSDTDFSVSGIVMAAGFIIVITMIRRTLNTDKLAFNVPIVLLAYYTILMVMCDWQISYFLLLCLVFSAISCLYLNFYRSVSYIIVQNLFVGFMIIRGFPVGGQGTSLLITLINWAICILCNVAMLMLARSATITLNKALENQSSFRDLLGSTENYVAMVDERNEIVYASKTLSMLGNIGNQELVQGRPFIDLFPGRTLKLYAGKMLKEKENYAEDWEFTLNGQKRYFKAASHSLPGQAANSLISLYDMTHLAERDEIAAMKDSMKIGLFFMDQNYVIQDHYSRYLEELLVEENLAGKLFTDVISNSVTPSELDSIKDYFGMIIEQAYDQDMLDDINPLNELHYINVRTGDRKVFQCEFATIERGQEVFLLVTVYDITTRVELQQRLAEEETKRQEEMQSLFELIQVDPDVFSDFSEDMEHEFSTIDKIQKDDTLSAHEVLVKVYQSIHAIKSNAVILGLNIFGNKAHNLESKIKKLREIQGNVPFVEMLNLTVDIEKLAQEKEGFKTTLAKLQSYGGGGSSGGAARQNVKVLLDSLSKTAYKAAEDMEKIVKFVSGDVDAEAIDNGPRRVIKEVLVQLIRNSIVHGIELPENRTAKGKNETGLIKLSIKLTEDNKYIHIKISDDGKGLDYAKIAERAIQNKIIKEEEAENKDMLIKAIFAPGFSTAETEGVHGGRGIGLNLVRDRIKEVNGTIKLKSEQDKGTLFFIAIPLTNQSSKS